MEAYLLLLEVIENSIY